MIKQLHMDRTIYEVMLAHVQAGYPLEVCGLLAGRNGRVSHLYAIRNRLAGPTAYEMDPAEQIQAMTHLEEQGNEMVAIYHSHPAGPETPSPTDVAQAYYPEAAHVIISLRDRKRTAVRAFTIISDTITEIPLSLE